MALKWCDSGSRAAWNQLLTWLSGLRLHLYSNNHTPAAGDDLTNYTEAAFGGYATSLIGTWTGPFTDGGTNHTFVTSPVILFRCTGSPFESDIGYYLTDGGSSTLILAEKFSSPFVFGGAGITLGVQLTVNMSSEF